MSKQTPLIKTSHGVELSTNMANYFLIVTVVWSQMWYVVILYDCRTCLMWFDYYMYYDEGEIYHESWFVVIYIFPPKELEYFMWGKFIIV